MLKRRFAARRIISDDDKYYNVIENLSADVLIKMDNLLRSLPRGNKYYAVKSALLEKYVEREASRINSFFNNIKMDSRTLFEFLEALTASGRDIFPRDSILRIWSERLPPYISVHFDTEINEYNGSFFVKKADKIHSTYSKEMQNRNISALDAASTIESPQTKYITSDKLEKLLDNKLQYFCNNINKNRSRKDKFQNKPNNKFQNKNKKSFRNKSQNKHFYNRDSSRARSSSRYRSRTPVGLCYYHETYGPDAHKCVRPCKWTEEIFF